jgi:Fe-S-cluster-containing hydrogenase component 2
VHPSPIGPLIHPDYGLWHAYRGTLAFADRIDLAPPDHRPSPSATCAEKPCLGACPVGALAPEAYEIAACVGHIGSVAGGECMGLGCAARRACPVGRDYLYEPGQASFHMENFLAKRQQRENAVP